MVFLIENWRRDRRDRLRVAAHPVAQGGQARVHSRGSRARSCPSASGAPVSMTVPLGSTSTADSRVL